MVFVVNKYWGDEFPPISKPKIVGYFSLDKDRKYIPDMSQIKYLVKGEKNRNVRFNLDALYPKFVNRPEGESETEKIDNLLLWISKNIDRIRNPEGSDKWLRPDFICFRGLMTKIWTTFYEKQDGWIICACKFRGNIYLCAYLTEKDKQRNASMPPRVERCCTWGYIFEHYLLTDRPNQTVDLKKKIYKGEEFACLFLTNFGSHLLFYGAEMDGVKTSNVVHPGDDLNKLQFVELKTNRHVDTFNQERILVGKKMLKWWCQCFLVGIQDVTCGFRNDAGMVQKITTYNLSDIVKLAKDFWRPSIAMNFGEAFLSYVKTTVQEDYNQCVYKFTWNPGCNVTVEKLPANSEFAFLPQWYTKAAEES